MLEQCDICDSTTENYFCCNQCGKTICSACGDEESCCPNCGYCPADEEG